MPIPYHPTIPIAAGLLMLAGCSGDRASSEMELNDNLEVSVSVPEEVRVGERYQIKAVVENESDHTLHGVRLRNVAASRQESGSQEQNNSWFIGSLAPGESKTITRSRTARKAGEAQMCWYAEYDPAVCLTMTRVQPNLQVRRQIMLDGEVVTHAYACDQVEVRYQIENVGNASFKKGSFNESLPDGVTSKDQQAISYTVPELAPGETAEKTIVLDFADKGDYRLQPELQVGDYQISTPEQTITVLEPSLAVSLDGPAESYVDRPVVYELAIENTSDDPALQVAVRLDGADQLKRLSMNKLEDGQMTIDRIGAGATRTFQISGIAAEKGTIEMGAQVQAYCVSPVTDQVATTVKGVPALRLETYDQTDPVAVGNSTSYKVTVRNQGSASDVDIDIAVTLPKHLTLVDSTGPTVVNAKGGKLSFGRLADIPPGESRTWELQAKAVEAGKARLQLELTSKDVRTPLLEQESTTIVAQQTTP